MLKSTLRQLLGALVVTVLATLGFVASNESAEREEIVVLALESDSQWG